MRPIKLALIAFVCLVATAKKKPRLRCERAVLFGQSPMCDRCLPPLIKTGSLMAEEERS